MNCIVIDDDHIVRKLIEEFIGKTNKLRLFGSYDNPVSALSEIAGSGKQVDIIFLDVEMPEMSGLELIENLKTKPQIIIISGKDKYALRAFDYDVTDYLLKPISYSRFYKAVERAIEHRDNSVEEINNKENKASNRNELFIKENAKLTRVRIDEIYYVEAQENYVSIQTYDNRYLIHFTMKAIRPKLPDDIFVRIHRSYYINIMHIHSITGNVIFMNIKEGEKQIPIGKSYKADLLDHLNLIK
ncbi:MAG: LytR/AlgR family response regulator transcription factor [Bacteroidota bacterium]